MSALSNALNDAQHLYIHADAPSDGGRRPPVPTDLPMVCGGEGAAAAARRPVVD
jgi:hypothetical protein